MQIMVVVLKVIVTIVCREALKALLGPGLHALGDAPGPCLSRILVDL